MNINQNFLHNYFLNQMRLSNNDIISKEIKKNFKISFKKINNFKNRELFVKYCKCFKKKTLISDNVIITHDIENFLEKIKDEKYIYITNNEGLKSFRNIYKNFLKNNKIFFYEKIKKLSLKNIIDFARDKKIDLVSIGGGKVIDLAKFISLKANRKLISIPTILATHVYASPKIHALKIIKKFGYKNTIDGCPSNLSIIDIKIIKQLYKNNPKFIYSGMGDLRAFYNSKLDWKENCNFDFEKFYFVKKSISKVEQILENINTKKPIINWIKKYIFAQVLLCNITNWEGSAPASGAEHFFANIYEKLYPQRVLHGELVALGTLIFSYLRGSNYKIIVTLMKKFKIGTSLKKMNVKKDRIIRVLTLCKKEGLRKKRPSILDKKKITKKDFSNLLNSLINKKILTI